MTCKEIFESKERIIEQSEVTSASGFLDTCFADIARYTVDGALVRHRLAAPLSDGLLGYDLKQSELDLQAPQMYAVFDSGTLKPEDIKLLTKIRLAQTRTQDPLSIAELKEQAFDLIRSKYVHGLVIQPFNYDDENGARQTSVQCAILSPKTLNDLITPMHVGNNRKPAEKSHLQQRIAKTMDKMQPVFRFAEGAAAIGLFGWLWISGMGHVFAASSSGTQIDNGPLHYNDIDRGDSNASIALNVGPTPASGQLSQLPYCNIRDAKASIPKSQIINNIKCIAAAFGALKNGYWMGPGDTVAFTLDLKTNTTTIWTDRGDFGDPLAHGVLPSQPVVWDDTLSPDYTHNQYAIESDGKGGFNVVVKSIPGSKPKFESTPGPVKYPDHKPGVLLKGDPPVQPTKTPTVDSKLTQAGPKTTPINSSVTAITPSPTPISAGVAPTTGFTQDQTSETHYILGASNDSDLINRLTALLIGGLGAGIAIPLGINNLLQNLDTARAEKKRKKPMSTMDSVREAEAFRERLAEIAEHNRNFNSNKLKEEARRLEQQNNLGSQLTKKLDEWLATHETQHGKERQETDDALARMDDRVDKTVSLWGSLQSWIADLQKDRDDDIKYAKERDRYENL